MFTLSNGGQFHTHNHLPFEVVLSITRVSSSLAQLIGANLCTRKKNGCAWAPFVFLLRRFQDLDLLIAVAHRQMTRLQTVLSSNSSLVLASHVVYTNFVLIVNQSSSFPKPDGSTLICVKSSNYVSPPCLCVPIPFPSDTFTLVIDDGWQSSCHDTNNS